jgi:hypothetical protein
VQERERDFGVGLNDFFNTVLSKSDKDGEEWRDTDPLGTGDRLNAAKLLQRAEEFISNPKKGPTFARAVFYIVAAGSLAEHDLTVWPSVSQVEHFAVLFRVLPSFIAASARLQPK